MAHSQEGSGWDVDPPSAPPPFLPPPPRGAAAAVPAGGGGCGGARLWWGGGGETGVRGQEIRRGPVWAAWGLALPPRLSEGLLDACADPGLQLHPHLPSQPGGVGDATQPLPTIWRSCCLLINPSVAPFVAQWLDFAQHRGEPCPNLGPVVGKQPGKGPDSTPYHLFHGRVGGSLTTLVDVVLARLPAELWARAPVGEQVLLARLVGFHMWPAPPHTAPPPTRCTAGAPQILA